MQLLAAGDLRQQADRELRFATHTVSLSPSVALRSNVLDRGSAHAPPIKGVRADCASRYGIEKNCLFNSVPAMLAAQQPALGPLLEKYVRYRFADRLG